MYFTCDAFLKRPMKSVLARVLLTCKISWP
jgi:hypothetical protein